jgi:hypothetical protein
MALTEDQKKAVEAAKARRLAAKGAKDEPTPQAAAPQAAIPRGQAPMAASGFMPSTDSSPESERLKRQAGVGLVRYGVPITAGFAAAPFTGFTSIPASMALISGIGGISGAGSEFAAQRMELGSGDRPEMDYGEVRRAGITSATPILDRGKLVSRLLTNIPSMLLTQEAGKGVAGEKMFEYNSFNEGLISMGIPVLIGGVSSVAGAGGKGIERRVAIGKEISEQRFGAQPTLSDILGRPSAIEARAFKNNNERARILSENISNGVDQAFAMAFPDVSETASIAADLAKQRGRLSKLEAQARAAADNVVAAQRRAEDALRNNRLQSPADVQAVGQAALQKASSDLLLKEGIASFLGTTAGSEILEAGDLSRLIKPVSDTIKAVDDNASTIIGNLYRASGIKENSPVADLKGALYELSRNRKGTPLEGNIAYNAARSELKFALEANKGVVTLERLKNIKEQIAKRLTDSNYPSNKVNATASTIYEAVERASSKFIKKNYSADVFDRYKTATQAARANFVARDATVVDALRSGNVDGVYQNVKNLGFSQTGLEIKAYQDAIINAANNLDSGAVAMAEEASEAFRRSVMGIIKAGVLKEAATIPGGVSAINSINPAELAQNLDMLRRRGVPIEELGLGDPNKLRALVRISGIGGRKMFSPEDLKTFLKEADEVGADAAAYREKFRTDYRKELIASSTVQGRRINVSRTASDFRKAKFSQTQLLEEIEQIKNNPVVKFMDLTGAGQTPNITETGDLVKTLFHTDGNVVRNLVRSIEQDPSRVGYLPVIRKNAINQVFSQFTDEGRKVNKAAVVTFFDGKNPDEIMAQKSLEAILGTEQFNNLKKTYYNAAKSALVSERTLMDGRIPPPGLIRSLPGAGRIIDYLQNGAYNMAYALYINPKTAPEYARLGYDINRFIASQPGNALILRAAQQEDEQANR